MTAVAINCPEALIIFTFSALRFPSAIALAFRPAVLSQMFGRSSRPWSKDAGRSNWSALYPGCCLDLDQSRVAHLIYRSRYDRCFRNSLSTKG